MPGPPPAPRALPGERSARERHGDRHEPPLRGAELVAAPAPGRRGAALRPRPRGGAHPLGPRPLQDHAAAAPVHGALDAARPPGDPLAAGAAGPEGVGPQVGALGRPRQPAGDARPRAHAPGDDQAGRRRRLPALQPGRVRAPGGRVPRERRHRRQALQGPEPARGEPSLPGAARGRAGGLGREPRVRAHRQRRLPAPRRRRGRRHPGPGRRGRPPLPGRHGGRARPGERPRAQRGRRGPQRLGRAVRGRPIPRRPRRPGAPTGRTEVPQRSRCGRSSGARRRSLHSTGCYRLRARDAAGPTADGVGPGGVPWSLSQPRSSSAHCSSSSCSR